MSGKSDAVYGPGHVLGGSGERLARARARDQFDLQRDRPEIPSSLVDLSDVIDDQGVYDGQHIAYDFDTGLYYHRSRQITFSQQPSGSAVVVSSTDDLDLPYRGILQQVHLRVSQVGTVDFGVSVRVNGIERLFATLTAGSAVADDFTATEAGFPIRVLDSVKVLVMNESDALGLTGWILV